MDPERAAERCLDTVTMRKIPKVIPLGKKKNVNPKVRTGYPHQSPCFVKYVVSFD